MLRLHTYDRSPFGTKVRLVLNEKGIPFEQTTPVDKATDPEFVKLNPWRLTPVLQLEDGRTIWESTVVCEYLEEAHPQPAMLPRDPYERARLRMVEDAADQYLYPAIRAVVTARFDAKPPYLFRRKPEAVDDAALKEARFKLGVQLDNFEAALGDREWFGGSMFSLTDAALAAPLTGTLRTIGELPRASCPRLEAWVGRLTARKSWAASRPENPLTIRESETS